MAGSIPARKYPVGQTFDMGTLESHQSVESPVNRRTRYGAVACHGQYAVTFDGQILEHTIQIVTNKATGPDSQAVGRASIGGVHRAIYNGITERTTDAGNAIPTLLDGQILKYTPLNATNRTTDP
jgi:hypothetical protein